jgi:Icc protein
MASTGAIFCSAWHGLGRGLFGRWLRACQLRKLLADTASSAPGKKKTVADFSFVQISDSHIGFNKAANQNVTGTLQKAIDKINAVPAGMKQPEFMIHTGDITQSSKPGGVRYGRAGDQGRQGRRGVLCSRRA